MDLRTSNAAAPARTSPAGSERPSIGVPAARDGSGHVGFDTGPLPARPRSEGIAVIHHQLDFPDLPPSASLSPCELKMLAFERHFWLRPGSKEQAIRDRFGLTEIRYYQLLNRLIDRGDALAYDPVLVGRLRRLRTRRRR